MAYDENLEKRLRELIVKCQDFYPQKMFGGVCFLMRGNICFGIWKDSLILRLGELQAQNALKNKNVRPFDITGHAMKGWVMQAIDFVSHLPCK